MAVPKPEPGLVVRYDYLWAREADAGLRHGKERPACLIVAYERGDAGIEAILVAITHRRPTGDTVGIEIPSRVRTLLGLDHEPCWVIVSEYNADVWPSPGVVPLPRGEKGFAYGIMPIPLFENVRARLIEELEARRIVRVPR
jgi:hypothetical protein